MKVLTVGWQMLEDIFNDGGVIGSDIKKELSKVHDRRRRKRTSQEYNAIARVSNGSQSADRSTYSATYRARLKSTEVVLAPKAARMVKEWYYMPPAGHALFLLPGKKLGVKAGVQVRGTPKARHGGWLGLYRVQDDVNEDYGFDDATWRNLPAIMEQFSNDPEN
ncbi:MAG: hypothetical protein LQ344_006856 [Seirophora lacunosa]|nr:MAG: hypothetical protein LQ344_006856 [Seirophora lacunosa]